MRIPNSLHFLVVAALWLAAGPLSLDLFGIDHMPPIINYQGHLTDTQGNPLTGNYNLKFEFWDSETGGNSLWSEEHAAVAVTDGLFQVNLGSTNNITTDILMPTLSPTDSFFDIYLEISIDGQIVSPRTAITSSPYAMLTNRVDGDITTAPGQITVHSPSDSPPLSSVLVLADDTCSLLEMQAQGGAAVTKRTDKSSPLLYGSWVESSQGIEITKVYDKASPQLYERIVESGDGAFLTKRIDKSSPQLMLDSIESGGGEGITRRIDKASPLLYQQYVESGDGSYLTKRIDQSSPQLMVDSIESGGGEGITRRIDKASPLLYQRYVESGDGVSLTKVYDKSSPLLHESMVESDDGITMSKVFDKSTPKLAGWSRSVNKGAKAMSDSVLMAMQVDTVGAYASAEAREGSIWGGGSWHVEPTEIEDHYHLKSGPQDSSALLTRLDATGCSSLLNWWGPRLIPITGFDSTQIMITGGPLGAIMSQRLRVGDGTLEAILGSTPPPQEEVSFGLVHSSSGIPMEEIAFGTGGGSTPVSMHMFNNASTGDTAPSDTNIQLQATLQGGTATIVNVDGTSGDGLAITIADDENALRLRHGGANTGVWLEANPTTGGRIGINTETPSEELQVIGDICASGNIGACSDLRFKKDVRTLTDALTLVEKLRGVRFDWNQSDFPQQHFNGRRQIGLVAQEVEKIVPEVVSRGSDGYYNLDYGKLTPLLIEAIKELKAENDELRALTERIAPLEKQIADLRTAIDKLAKQ